jgi:hypothetical protein
MKVYFENCIESGRARAQPQPDQMTAVRSLMKAAEDGKLELVNPKKPTASRIRSPLISAQNWLKQGEMSPWSLTITSSSVSITRWIASAQ